ncbi:hypothetical protein [Kitasatospora cathayae]|uniref:DUF5753 domain-containing protein n=1 Tax=Kitasatospora cathayae TaxID=3004092 RepID=A0ABY7QHP4_9ACTN|nr:hypothetical protein [Kitasatospora sp. HUAS 3-15]WBP91991.1 hypothetical protein O1G21_40075 [Kitasatospora sp. HUAS 3-15]
MNTRPAHIPLITGQVSSIELFLAQASLDPRVRLHPAGTVEDALTTLAAHRALMEPRLLRALPAAPRRPELLPGPPRQLVFVADEAALLFGQPRTGKHSPEAFRLIREILAAGRTTGLPD